jgi:hypothetical protein
MKGSYNCDNKALVDGFSVVAVNTSTNLTHL